MEINLRNKKKEKWVKQDEISYIGLLEETIKKGLITSITEEKINKNKIEEILRGNKQFFSLVIETEEVIVAAVDHLRMYPLFYANKEGNTYLSDDVSWIVNRIKADYIDDLAETEYLMTGYVTGKETLYKDIKQLQAGEYLIYNRKEREMYVKQYNKFEIMQEPNYSKKQLFYELDSIHLTVFKRMIDSLNGRTAVLPLSGGYDSRVIAMMLKRLGYENVICFSYGIKNSWEVKIAKEIAESLNYKWIFIEYTSLKWKNWAKSKSMKELLEGTNDFASLPHIQDNMAIEELNAKNLIPDDSYIIPGHTAFLSFSDYKQDIRDLQQLVDVITNKHYNLWNWTYKGNGKYKYALEEKIINEIKALDNSEGKFNNLDNIFYFWEQRERHAKFICNSVRTYELFKYEWRLPLWEKEMISFWLNTPQEYRVDKKLYKEYFDLYFNVDNIRRDVPNLNNNNKKGLKRFFKKNKWIYGRLVSINNTLGYYNHPLNWYKIISYKIYIRGLLNGAKNINSYLVDFQLKNIHKLNQ